MEQLTYKICCKYPNAKYKHPCDQATFEFRGFKSPVDDIRAKQEKFFIVLYGDWSGGTNPDLSCESHTYISDCQLVLKPLEEISDEDAIEVAKIANPSIGIDAFSKARFGKELINDYLYRTSNVYGADWFKIGDYLRLTNHDIDDLIKRKLAVKIK